MGRGDSTVTEKGLAKLRAMGRLTPQEKIADHNSPVIDYPTRNSSDDGSDEAVDGSVGGV